MSTILGPYQLGPDMTELTLIGGVLVNGVFTSQATYDLTDIVVASDFQPQTRTKNVKPCTVYGMNHVPVEAGVFASIRGLKHSLVASKLEKIKFLHTHCQLYRKTGRDRYIGKFLIANGGAPHEGVEEQFASLDLEPVVFTGEAQVTRTEV